MLDANDPILVVLENDRDLEEVVRHLIRVGYVKFAGYLVGGMPAWAGAGNPLAKVPQMPVEEVHSARNLQILDVRSDHEWRGGHIPGAEHIFVADLPRSLRKLNREQAIAVYCGGGYRASLAASILEAGEFKSVHNIAGSWQAWKNAGYPIEK
jgi:hydroxyacylglutathione hydrolase